MFKNFNPFYLRKIIKEQAIAIDVLSSPDIINFNYSVGETVVSMRHRVVSVMAYFLSSYLSEVPGKDNYVEVTLNSEEHGPLLLTIQRVHGKTPNDLKVEAEAELERILSSTVPYQTGVLADKLKDLKEAFLVFRAMKEADKKEAISTLLSSTIRLFEFVETLDCGDLQYSIVPGIYQHYKGMKYRVTGIHKNSETQELMVAYEALYPPYDKWIRPFSMFSEQVETELYTGPRFTLILPEGK
jgi:hypothetical protein